MTWAQTINDLRGAPTMQEGQQALARTYQSLLARKATRAAREVVSLMNEFGSWLCEREGDLTDWRMADVWGAGRSGQACYPKDQAIPQFLKDKLRQLSASLERADIPEAGNLDPATDGAISEEIKSGWTPRLVIAGGGVLLAFLIGLFLWLGGARG